MASDLNLFADASMWRSMWSRWKFPGQPGVAQRPTLVAMMGFIPWAAKNSPKIDSLAPAQAFAAAAPAGGGGGAVMESIVFHADNPFNPFGIDVGPAEIQDGFMTRRPLEAGPRIFDQHVDTYHIAGALEGETVELVGSRHVVTGELDHPNIVPIYELGTDDSGELFYSMKRVQGTPWMDVIGQKSEAENIEILMRVADAVAFAHSRGIVHRDLKPANIRAIGLDKLKVGDIGYWMDVI